MKTFFVVTTVVLGVLLAYLFFQNERLKSEKGLLLKELTLKGGQHFRCSARADSLMSTLRNTDSLRRYFEKRAAVLLDEYDIRQLKKKGLENPESDIKQHLMVNARLIPYSGRMGGTMGFYSPDNIYVLNDRWVVAYFEDGHNAGEMLLEYSVGPNGKIIWQVLDIQLL